MIGKKSKANKRTFITLLLMLFFATLFISFAVAPSIIINTISFFNQGNYTNTSINSSGVVKFIKELPNNRSDESANNGINMTGNVLLMHLNNNSAYGESSTFFYDFSGMNNNGSCNSGLGYCPNWTAGGKLGSAYRFDGTNDYINIPFNNSLNITDKITISAWFNARVLGNGYIVDKANDFLIRTDGDEVRFYTISPNDGLNSNNVNLVVDKWYFVTITYDKDGGTNNKKLYVNGSLVAQTTITGPLRGSNNPITIGGTSVYFNGLIDEVVIWNRTLSADEISKIYNLSSAKYGIYQSKVYDMNGSVYWKNMSWTQGGPNKQELPNNRETETQWLSGNLNMTGNVVLFHLNNDPLYSENSLLYYDFSGMGNNGAGDDGSCSGGNCPTWTPAGKLGGAYTFDGLNDYATIPYNTKTEFGFGDFAYSFWIKPNKINTFQALLVHGYDPETRLVPNNKIETFFHQGGCGLVYSSTVLSVGEWYFITITKRNGMGYVYVNGKEENSTNASSCDGSPGIFWRIGRHIEGGGFFNGTIDEIAIWNRSLSRQEIKDIYQRGANKLSLQVRSCDDNLCSNANWIGPFGTTAELPNNKEDERILNSKGANMTGNVLLMHLNNNSAYGENSTSFYDFSGMNNNGSCNSGLGYCPSFSSSGKFGNDMNFDGSNNYIDVADSNSLDITNAITLSAWVKYSGIPNDIGNYDWYAIIMKGNYGGAPYGLMQNVQTSGSPLKGLRFYINGNEAATYSFTTIQNNVWYHVAATYDRSYAKIYVDGEEKIKSPFTNSISTNANNLIIGKDIYDGGYPFKGEIDDVAIWNRSLNATEIYDVYNREKNNYFTNCSLGNLSKISNKRYFQYKAIFETEDSGALLATPEFFNITFNYEHGPPVVTLNNPADDTLVNSSIVNLNCSAGSSNQLTNITFYINSTGTFTANATAIVVGNSNSTNLTLVLPDAYYKFNCLAYNEYNLSSFASANYTFFVDATIPFINFTTPTDNDGAHVGRSNTYINITASDATLSSAFIDFNRSLVGYWNFNSNNSNDSSTYGNDGTNYGAVWNSSGRYSGGMQFDGNVRGTNDGNYIAINDHASLRPSIITLEAWMYQLGPSIGYAGYGIILSKEGGYFTSEADSGYTLRTSPSNFIFALGDGTGWNAGTLFTVSSSYLPMRQWHHIVGTFNGSAVKIYIDGQLRGQWARTTPILHSLNARLEIGNTDPTQSQGFNGTIDEVRIWNRALNDNEINASYNVGIYRLERNFTNLTDGNYTYQAWAVDRAGNINKTETRSVIIDLTSPTITNITLKSNDTTEINDIDAGDKVNVTVNATDISGISVVKLLYKYYTSSSYINVTMYNDTFGGSIYNATFIPTIEGNWTYRIWANDTLGNEIYTNATNVSANYEYTWTRTPTSLGTVSGLLNLVRAIGNITVNNTGDSALGYSLTHNSPYDISFSDSLFVLQSKESKTIEVTATFGPITREYDLSITIDAIDAFADPGLTTTNFSLASYSGGPYFDVQIDVYPAMMNHSEIYDLSGYVKNLGNETGTGTSLNWTLPAGFIVNSGNITLDIGNITAGSTNRTTLNITAPPTLSTGAYTFSLYSACEQCSNITCSNESYYINDSQSKIITVICSKASDGTCGKGCSYDENASNYDSDCTVPVATTTIISSGGGGMGGGGGAAITSEATFELVRGKDEGFSLEIKNPYSDAKLTNLKVSVEGYLAQYITVEYPNNIAPGSSATLTIKIAAPAYFTKGIHNLTFIVDSIKEKGLIKESWSEKRYVTLAIHEVSKTESLALLNETEKIIEEMKTANFGTKTVSKLLAQSQSALDSNDYEEIQRINEMIKGISQSAFDAINLINEIALKIEESSYKGINTPETSRLLELAKVAAEREDYALAFERAKEAELTYSVETKGEFNIAYFVARNSTEVFIGILIALCLLFMLYLRARLILVNIGIKETHEEEDVLLGLMKETQKETFIENKRSMEEYNESMMQYENRLSNAVQKAIELETVKSNLFRFMGERKRLEQERDRLFELMKETQAKYLQGGMIESRIYQDKMHSFSSRLSEIEEKLALREAETAIRRGKMPPILREITLPRITLWKHEKEKIIEEEPEIITAKEKPVEIPKEEKKWVEELIEGKPETLRERIKKIKRYGRLDIPKVDNPFLVPFVKPEKLDKIKKKKG